MERKIVGGDCLVLNSNGLPMNMLPISTCSWREAITAEYLDQVVVLKYHDDWIVRSAHKEFKVPSVVMKKVWTPKSKSVRYSKNNVFLRDRYKCQYCGESFAKADLTVDHVTPRVAGGGSTWENIVTACKPCNGNKGHKTKGWVPLNSPRKPTYGELVASMKSLPLFIRDLEWNVYLGWGENLVSKLDLFKSTK